MSSIDQRVVEMKFDNSQFSKGISKTMDDVAKLNAGMKLTGAKTGLTDLSKAAAKTDLSGLSGSIDKIGAKFGAMSIIAITALANITTKAIDTGIQMAKSMTITPAKDGFAEYELKMGSIQTIMAGTGEDLKTVNGYLNDLNEYSDKTIYSFKDMTSNIGKFTNSGVSLKDSVAAIQGVSNAAALSGANSNEASRAMYNFAQALSTGSVKLIDWKSIENANMATQDFKQQLMDGAVATGTLTKASDGLYKTLDGTSVTTLNFKDTLSEAWLTSDALVGTLGKYSDETTDLGKRAAAAAQDVKTFSQMMDTMKESAGSGWAMTSEIIFGNFEEGKKLWTGVNDVFGQMITNSAESRNKLLGLWKDAGGRDDLFEGIRLSFEAITTVLKPIQMAFRDIFPATTARNLLDMTRAFLEFAQNLSFSKPLLEDIRSSFRGLFAVVGIGWEVIKAFGIFLFKLFSGAGDGATSFLSTTASIGDFLVAVHKAVKEGEGLTHFFDILRTVIKVPLELLKKLAGVLFDVFTSIRPPDLGDFSNVFADLEADLEPLAFIGDRIAEAWDKVVPILKKVKDSLQPIVERFSGVAKIAGGAIKESFDNLDWDLLLSGIRTGLMGAMVIQLKKFTKSMTKTTSNSFNFSLFEGVFGQLNQVFGTLTTTLTEMQKVLKATVLLEIALAVGVLAVSMVLIAGIDAAGLAKATAAITAMFAQLLVATAIMSKIVGAKGMMSLPVVAAGLLILSTAVLVLAIAVRTMAGLEWGELAKGLGGVTVLLGVLVATAQLLKGVGPQLAVAGTGLLVLSTGILVLAAAVKVMGELSLADLASGLIGVGSLLGGLGLFLKFAALDKSSVIKAAGLVVLANAILILSSAVSIIGSMSFGSMVTGLVGLAGALGIVIGALYLMPPTSLASAAAVFVIAQALLTLSAAMLIIGSMDAGSMVTGLVGIAGGIALIVAALALVSPGSIMSAIAVYIVAQSLTSIAIAMTIFGRMSWEEIARGLVAMAGALLIIAGAMYLMSAALPGAAALIVVAGALMILAPALVLLGTMSWDAIIRSLAMLAGTLLIFGLAALAMTPIVPVILALAAAILILGAGIFLAGAGIGIAVAALAAFAAVAGAAAAAVGIVLGALGAALPPFFKAIGEAFMSFLSVVAASGKVLYKLFSTILGTIIDVVGEYAPKILGMIYDMLVKFLKLAADNIGPLVAAGARLIIGFINGLASHVGDIVAAAVNYIVAFLKAIQKQFPLLADQGAKTIIAYINAVAEAIENNHKALEDAGVRLAKAIIAGMVSGLKRGVKEVGDAAAGLGNAALDKVKGVLNINSPSKAFMHIGDDGIAGGLSLGINNGVGTVVKSAGELGSKAIDSLGQALSGMKTMFEMDVDLNPVITPVLDMDQAVKDASVIGDLIPKQAISVDMGYTQAKDTSLAIKANQVTTDEVYSEPKNDVTFNQYNNSPKALSPAEIYRQTKNQLSVAKGV